MTRLDEFLTKNRIPPRLLLRAIANVSGGHTYSDAYLYQVRRNLKPPNIRVISLTRAAVSSILDREVALEELFDFSVEAHSLAAGADDVQHQR